MGILLTLGTNPIQLNTSRLSEMKMMTELGLLRRHNADAPSPLLLHDGEDVLTWDLVYLEDSIWGRKERPKDDWY